MPLSNGLPIGKRASNTTSGAGGMGRDLPWQLLAGGLESCSLYVEQTRSFQLNRIGTAL